MKNDIACLTMFLGIFFINETMGWADNISVEEALVGTWHVCGLFDQYGNYVPIEETGFKGRQFFTFEENGTFSAVFNSDQYLNSSFSGAFDYSESQKNGKNPHKWLYYLVGDPKSVVNKGTSTLERSRLEFIFQFIDFNGKMLLYDGITRLYYEKR
ncbi:MAG: hypothetical protein GX751_08400 [Desulfuromonadaceae bacterium]|nr:hypothetical protein [Desulfuromonadaceae bacterium]